MRRFQGFARSFKLRRSYQRPSKQLSPFRTVYGIHDIKKIVDTDTGPVEEYAREAHSILDYEGWIVTDKTD